MAAHPGVADHQVLDRGPLGVAQVERARDVRRRLDDRERRQGRVGGRRRRRRARRRPPPASARRSRPRPRAACRPSRARRHARSPSSSVRPRNTNARSSSGRTGRGTTCWFGARGGSLIAIAGFRTPSWRAIGRHPSRLASDLHAGGPARLAPSRARSEARPGATPLGHRREAGSVARGRGLQAAISARDVSVGRPTTAPDRSARIGRTTATAAAGTRPGGSIDGQVHGRPRRVLRRVGAAARGGAPARPRHRGPGGSPLRARLARPRGRQGLLPGHRTVEGGGHARPRAARAIRRPQVYEVPIEVS